MELPMDYCLHLLIPLTSWLAPLDCLIRLFKFKFWLTAGKTSVHQYHVFLSVGLPQMSPGRNPCLLCNISSVEKTHLGTQSCFYVIYLSFSGLQFYLVQFFIYTETQEQIYLVNKFTYQQVIQPNARRGSCQCVPREI